MTTLVHVESKSKPGSYHVVDTVAVTCDCRGFQYRGKCRHLAAAMPKPEAAPAKPKRKLGPWIEEIDRW